MIGVHGCLSSFSSGQPAEPDLRRSSLLLRELPEGHLGSVVIILKQKQTKIETEWSLMSSGSLKSSLPFLDSGVLLHPIDIGLSSHPGGYTTHLKFTELSVVRTML